MGKERKKERGWKERGGEGKGSGRKGKGRRRPPLRKFLDPPREPT